MTHKKTTHSHAITLLIIIAIITLCPIANATQTNALTIALTIEPTTSNFLNSQHFKEKTTQINGEIHYKTDPNIETILDYIFTQSPYLLNHSANRVYLNIKDNSIFFNREVIAHSRKLTPNETTQYQDTTSFPTKNSIATNLHSLPDNDMLIAKTPENNTSIGVFINIQNLKTLEPKISTNFKWISTAKWYHQWFDTIYEPQKESKYQ